MKKIKATLMAVVAVLALVTFISPVSAVLIDGHDITFVSHTFNGTHSTWTYNVTSSFQPAISHWVMTWCNENALVGCSEDCEYVKNDPGGTGLTGIKFGEGYSDNEIRTVWFTLEGDFNEIDNVLVCTKAGQDDPACGYVTGPVNCNTHIPEFTTIAIPVAAILGLLFFFNHRKRKKS